MRITSALVVGAAGFALAAAPAHAAHIYAGQPSGSSPFQFVMGLNNAATKVANFTFHFDVSCPSDFRSVDFGSAQIVADTPEAMAFGAHYMVAPVIKQGKLNAKFMGFDQTGETEIERMTATITGTFKPGAASGRLQVQFMAVDTTTSKVVAQCARNFPWKALRNPGVVYGGKTSQDEPVVVELTANRKKVDHAHLGWWADCAQGGGWTEAHDEFDLKPFALSSSGAFARVYSFSFGPGSGEVEHFAGKVGATKASGTFSADVTTAGDTGADTCNTGAVSWKAVTG